MFNVWIPCIKFSLIFRKYSRIIWILRFLPSSWISKRIVQFSRLVLALNTRLYIFHRPLRCYLVINRVSYNIAHHLWVLVVIGYWKIKGCVCYRIVQAILIIVMHAHLRLVESYRIIIFWNHLELVLPYFDVVERLLVCLVLGLLAWRLFLLLQGEIQNWLVV